MYQHAKGVSSWRYQLYRQPLLGHPILLCLWLMANTCLCMFSMKKLLRANRQGATHSQLLFVQHFHQPTMHLPSQNLVASTKGSCAHMGKRKQRQTLLLTMQQPPCRQTFWPWLVVSDNIGLRPGWSANLPGFALQ